ncbi:hypothetical protein [Pseudoxanthomonas mexicana]
MHFITAFLLLATLVLVWLFYDRFTRRGAIPLTKAARDFTAWLGYAGIALADWGVHLLRYLADLWEPVQAQWGTLLANPSLAQFVQVLSFVFLVAKLKGQTPLPRPALPDLPASPGAGT